MSGSLAKMPDFFNDELFDFSMEEAFPDWSFEMDYDDEEPLVIDSRSRLFRSSRLSSSICLTLMLNFLLAGESCSSSI